mgnify:CR=1 FL=1|tara:strand:- start:52 stop:528 length:477 start_codon:yes stop_codon:yes gene_type:complete
MQKVISKSLLFLILLLTVSCGYKVLNETEENKFSIQAIRTTGDKRINFKIKNDLINSAKKNNENILSIDLNTKKTKSIKEKNIRNEITKYEILLEVDIRFNLINTNENYKIILANKGEYLVVESYSATLNNEKKLIDDLIASLSEKIQKKISQKLNDI